MIATAISYAVPGLYYYLDSAPTAVKKIFRTNELDNVTAGASVTLKLPAINPGVELINKPIL
jgi:hypothetical protein